MASFENDHNRHSQHHWDNNCWSEECMSTILGDPTCKGDTISHMVEKEKTIGDFKPIKCFAHNDRSFIQNEPSPPSPYEVGEQKCLQDRIKAIVEISERSKRKANDSNTLSSKVSSWSTIVDNYMSTKKLQRVLLLQSLRVQELAAASLGGGGGD